MRKENIILGIVFVLVVSGGIFFASNLDESPVTTLAVAEGTQESNCQQVRVPYEEQEEYLKTEYYTETVPYEKDIPLKYEDGNLYSEPCSNIGNYKKCFYVGVMNLDTVGGIFEVNCNFRTLNREFSDSQSLYVKPGETEKFRCDVDVDLGEDVEMTYAVESPTKEVTDYKDVRRERQVTAFRPVTKYRTETKCD